MRVEQNDLTRRVIRIEKGSEYAPKFNDDVEAENAFFGEVYQQAKFVMEEIVLRMEAERKTEEPKSFRDRSEDMSVNNVIAFCAERGNGKTSAMLSFAKEFEAFDHKNGQKNGENLFLAGTELEKHSYVALRQIDPTNIEVGGSILKVVVSRLLESVSKDDDEKASRWNRYPEVSKAKMAERDDLLELLQKCFHEIEVLHDGKSATDWPLDELEQLAELGDSTNLRASFCQAIERYLNYAKGPDSYLILQIDDADTNIEQSYQILEDVRKYLSIPRVILLMASNMQQMEATIEQSFLERYKTSLAFKESMIDVERCHDAAERYLEKVIPGSHRIYLPSLANTLAEGFIPIVIEYYDPKKNNKLLLPVDRDYQEQLLGLLHEKTGLIFLETSGYLHNFLPSNFRDLTHFLADFSAMENCPPFEKDIMSIRALLLQGDADKTRIAKGEILHWRQRLERLERYLIHTWAAANLRQNARALLSTLKHQAWRSKHRYLAHTLPRYYDEDCKEASIEKFYALCESKGEAVNDPAKDSSYQTVVVLLDALTSIEGSERYYKLAYAIHLYYSICLHKLVLDDVQSLSKEPSANKLPISQVASFIQDISLFWVGNGQKEAFGHYRPEKDFDPNAIQRFIRYPVQEGSYEIFYGGDKEGKVKSLSSGPVYDPSYLLLNNADWIANATTEEDRDLSSDLCVFSMILLLNWDVQRDIRHEIKRVQRNLTASDCLNATRVCYGEASNLVYKKVGEQESEYQNLKEIAEEIATFLKTNEKEFVLLQMSEETKAIVKKILDECRRAIIQVEKTFESDKDLEKMLFLDWNETSQPEIEKAREALAISLWNLNDYLPFAYRGEMQEEKYPVLHWLIPNINNQNPRPTMMGLNMISMPMEEICKQVKKELKAYADEFDIKFTLPRRKKPVPTTAPEAADANKAN